MTELADAEGVTVALASSEPPIDNVQFSTSLMSEPTGMKDMTQVSTIVPLALKENAVTSMISLTVVTDSRLNGTIKGY